MGLPILHTRPTIASAIGQGFQQGATASLNQRIQEQQEEKKRKIQEDYNEKVSKAILTTMGRKDLIDVLGDNIRALDPKETLSLGKMLGDARLSDFSESINNAYKGVDTTNNVAGPSYGANEPANALEPRQARSLQSGQAPMLPYEQMPAQEEITPKSMKGMLAKGNIDLNNRPRVRNPDGSISTVRSKSFGIGGKEVLLPTISDDGRNLNDREALEQYRRTGKHLGIFSTPEEATKYAINLHNQQAELLNEGTQGYQNNNLLDIDPKEYARQETANIDRAVKKGLSQKPTGQERKLLQDWEKQKKSDMRANISMLQKQQANSLLERRTIASEYKVAREGEQKNVNNYIESSQKQYTELPYQKGLLNMAEQSLKSGKFGLLSPDNIANYTHIDAFRTPEGEGFRTAIKDYFLTDIRSAGARPNMFIEKMLADILPTVGKTKRSEYGMV